MNDARKLQLFSMEQDLAQMVREEQNPVQKELLEKARDAVGGAAFGPPQKVYYLPGPFQS